MTYVQKPGANVESFAVPRTGGVQYWHLLRAKAMEENKTALLLDWLGMAAYVPLRIKTRKLAKSRFQIRHVPVKKAAIAGYVFAGFRRGAPDWLKLLDSGLVRSVVTMSSEDGRKPYPIRTQKVLEIYQRQIDGEFNQDAKPYRPPAKLEAGETLRVMDDCHPLFGREYVAQSVEDGRASVLHEWFGKVDLVELSLDAVAKVA